nr:MAG TPA: hypothetical protein [Caudoviricetes sp.]DAX93056.1 MAG TPA: hypothetical protein [Caudoviricetes sp.]
MSTDLRNILQTLIYIHRRKNKGYSERKVKQYERY